MDSLAGKEPAPINSLSAQQRLFLGFPNVWCQNRTDSRFHAIWLISIPIRGQVAGEWDAVGYPGVCREAYHSTAARRWCGRMPAECGETPARTKSKVSPRPEPGPRLWILLRPCAYFPLATVKPRPKFFFGVESAGCFDCPHETAKSLRRGATFARSSPLLAQSTLA